MCLSSPFNISTYSPTPKSFDIECLPRRYLQYFSHPHSYHIHTLKYFSSTYIGSSKNTPFYIVAEIKPAIGLH